MLVWIKTAIQLLKFIDKMLVTSDLIIFTSRYCNCLLPKPFFSTHFSYLTIVESLPTYGTHYYEVKVKKKNISSSI